MGPEIQVESPLSCGTHWGMALVLCKHLSNGCVSSKVLSRSTQGGGRKDVDLRSLGSMRSFAGGPVLSLRFITRNMWTAWLPDHSPGWVWAFVSGDGVIPTPSLFLDSGGRPFPTEAGQLLS